mmetsp:Transcript_34659/g.98196  ORF Transcript_34659/g.98196 Transcript_34659/m.98196 type:complete len:304 (-) Transcript_34659:21-932(-)
MGAAAPRRLQRLSAQLNLSPASSSSREGLLSGQVAIITGAAQGLGAAASRLFAQEGCRVVACDLDKARVEGVVAEIVSRGGAAVSVAGDVTSNSFADSAVQAAVASFGRLDILVNNAGYTWDGMVHKMSDQQWEAMMAVHCTAPFKLIKAAAPHMRDAAKQELKATGHAAPRSILNISSVSGTHGNVGQANYSTAKMGVVGLTKTIAKEWGPFNIRCNCISFGYMDTRLTQAKEEGESISVCGKEVKLGIPSTNGMLAAVEAEVPLGRMGTADEGAGAMLLLVSPLASYITGQTLEVAGGAKM